MVSVPNRNSVTAMFCRLSYRLTLGHLKVPARMFTQTDYVSHHRLYFNKQSLRRFFEMNHYDVEFLQAVPTIYADALFKRLSHLPGIVAWFGAKILTWVQAMERVFKLGDTLILIARPKGVITK